MPHILYVVASGELLRSTTDDPTRAWSPTPVGCTVLSTDQDVDLACCMVVDGAIAPLTDEARASFAALRPEGVDV